MPKIRESSQTAATVDARAGTQKTTQTGPTVRRVRVEAAAPEFAATWDELPPGSLDSIPRESSRTSVLTRAFEFCVASIALLIASPVIAIIAIMIKKGSPGPVFFKQQRLGLNGELFTLIKFRTLYVDAKERYPELYAYKYSDQDIKNLVFKSADDPRITPQGRWLRKTSLDELPNLWNVLKGDMALVGPRPDIPEMLPYYRGEMLKRFVVRPGLTGLAHVSGRSDLTFMRSVEYDLEYVRRRSWRLDATILFKTFVVVVLGKGAF